MPLGVNFSASLGVPNTPGPGAINRFTGGENVYFEPAFSISGVSRDSAGAALAGCTCILYRIVSPVESRQEQSVVSDANGVYSFTVENTTSQWRVTFDLAGAPARAGITKNDLVGS